MATQFLEPGGDSTFDFTLFGGTQNTPTIVTDFVHGSHVKSIKCGPTTRNIVDCANNVVVDAGGRWSYYIYIVAYPSTSRTIVANSQNQFGNLSDIFKIRMTSAGVLLFVRDDGTQLGTNGSTLSLNTWYRLSCAWVVTSTTVYDLRLWVNGTLSISVTNGTALNATGQHNVYIGNAGTDSSFDHRISDIYIDNSSSLVDIASDVWVTAKRPFSNGTTNGFTTQIGSGGSGYGSGHAPQVNERPLNTTNGWSMVGAGSAVTEEYTVEGASTGDINISAATLIDYMGWVYASSLVSETAQIIVGGTNTNISLTSTNTAFRQAKGSTSYPSGGTDIGIITATTVTTVSLYECGLMFAYTPASATIAKYGTPRLLMGVGT